MQQRSAMRQAVVVFTAHTYHPPAAHGASRGGRAARDMAGAVEHLERDIGILDLCRRWLDDRKRAPVRHQRLRHARAPSTARGSSTTSAWPRRTAPARQRSSRPLPAWPSTPGDRRPCRRWPWPCHRWQSRFLAASVGRAGVSAPRLLPLPAVLLRGSVVLADAGDEPAEVEPWAGGARVRRVHLAPRLVTGRRIFVGLNGSAGGAVADPVGRRQYGGAASWPSGSHRCDLPHPPTPRATATSTSRPARTGVWPRLIPHRGRFVDAPSPRAGWCCLRFRCESI